jgi:cell division protein FtsN
VHSPDPDFVERLFALAYTDTPYSTDPTVENRLMALEALVAQHRPDPEIIERLNAMETRQEALEEVRIQPAAPVVYHAPPQVVQHVPVQGTQPRVIPGIPDPNSGKNYRLQVGAFSTPEAADRIARMISSVGFNVAWEQSGLMYRILATDVPAAMVHSAVQRLGVMGINQVWVRE